jgi:hypothetical protein
MERDPKIHERLQKCLCPGERVTASVSLIVIGEANV